MKLVIHNEGPALLGSERQIVIIAQGLAGRGHEVVVSCHPDGPLRRELERIGVRTTAVRPRGDADLVSALRFALFLRRERPRAVMLTAWRRLYWSTWAARIARVPRVVVRLGLERPVPARYKYRSAFRRVDALIANSNDVAETFLDSAPGFPRSAVHVIRNAVSIRIEGGNGVRDELGIPPGTPLIVSVGSLTHRKGVDVLLEAFTEVENAHLALVGDGPQAEEVRRGVAELRLGGRVHLMGSRDDVGAILAGADAFVLASRNDSLPNAMLEAMAAKLPVVVTAVAGVREALGATAEHGPAGWVVPPADATALAHAIRSALDAVRTGEADAVAREAERRAREWFGPGRMVDEIAGVLFGASAAVVT